MTTTWKPNKSDDSRDKKSSATVTSNSFSGSSLTSWSRQQKFAMIASFSLLAVLLVVTACSKQSPKPALAAVSGPSISPSAAAASANAAINSAAVATPTPSVRHGRKEGQEAATCKRDLQRSQYRHLISLSEKVRADVWKRFAGHG